MSRIPKGSSGLVNGDHGPNGANPYRDGGPMRSGREHRVGGYGGLEINNGGLSIPRDYDVVIPTSVDEQSVSTNNSYDSSRDRRYDRDHGGWQNTSRSRGRDGIQNTSNSYGNGPGGRQIEDVLHHINDKWEIMARDECVPVYLALQLMDHSSLGRGRDYQDFQRTSRHLQKALRSIVNEHHQGFNSSIGTFHKIQSSITASQGRVWSLRESVCSAKSSLMEAKPELQDLGTASQRYENMLHVLNQIEKLQTLPEILDVRIADKKFLAAVDILQDALRMIRKSEMENIGALSDLRVYFSNQETSLTDILVEELHDHLYLKTLYSQSRWKSNDNVQSSLPNTWGRPVYAFLNSLDTTVPFNDETMSNPQVDSFRYIHMLLEALNRLGCLDVAVDRIEQRLPVELFAIVDRTNQEVDLRHPLHLRSTGRLQDALLSCTLPNSNRQSDVLDDLLWTLYSKFEAIAEGHRVVHDVVLGIARRNGLRRPESLIGSFKELWKLYQSELRSLLHDYLTTDESSLIRNGRSVPSDVSQLQKTRRDRLKRVFKLADLDQKVSNFTAEQEELNKILQNSVPGLVSKSQRQLDNRSNMDNVSKGGPATHKLLVEPSVFNIAILLPPSLSFLQRLKDIVPLDSDIAISTLTSFLDDFLVNVFLPQLEETVAELCEGSYMGPDGFQQDPSWQQEAPRPILKSTSDFFKLIKTFCRLFDSLPHDQSFIQPILSQLVSYYDRCCGWYKSMVQRGTTQLKPAAAMIESGELRQIMNLQWESQFTNNDQFIQKEVGHLVPKISESPLVPTDIISDQRTVASLCLLYNSMQWLATGLSQTRHVVQESQASKRGFTRPQQLRRWTLLELNRRPSDAEPIRLPMNHETATTFDGIVDSIRALALDALFTLQIDIRCGITHMTTQMLSTPYLLSYPTNNPDPSVLSLNSDLLSFDDALSTYLSSKEHGFITAGLAMLVDMFLVANASRIQSMNAHGCGRMQLNILVLQQNLKTIEGDASLSRSAHFFELFAEGADAIVARAREVDRKDANFTREEYKALIELCHSEGLQSTQREASVQARRRLTEHLKQLEEVM